MKKIATLILFLAAAVALVVAFHGKIFLTSVDTVNHFQLIDQLARHGGYTIADRYYLGDMYGYPSGSHWLAAIFAPFDRSFGLISMSEIAIVSVFVSYVLIAWLLQQDLSLVALLLFALLLYAFSFTKTLIGWELVDWNFFYPQIVADALLFACLCWLASTKAEAVGALMIAAPIACAVAAWVQPLIALHIAGTICCLLFFRFLSQWIEQRKIPWRPLAATLIAGNSSVAVIVLSPGFRTMRANARWYADLQIGYPNVGFIVAPALSVAAFALWRVFHKQGTRTDAVIGSSLMSAALLVIAQDAALHVFGIGTTYAVRKHLFIVTTLLVVALARLVAKAVAFVWEARPSGPAGVAVAALITVWIVVPTLHPAAPIVARLQYADRYASQPGFKPGSVISNDHEADALVNVMTSLVGLKYPRRFIVNVAFYYGGRPGQPCQQVYDASIFRSRRVLRRSSFSNRSVRDR